MTYTPEKLVLLLPTVWDWSITTVRSPYEPDPDMPKVKADPKLTGTTMAMIADVRGAWRNAPLELEQRQSLLLTHGLDMSQAEVADKIGSTQQTISRINAAGIRVLLFWLNGKEWEDGDDDKETEDQ